MSTKPPRENEKKKKTTNKKGKHTEYGVAFSKAAM
jgi:hypothetical protein